MKRINSAIIAILLTSLGQTAIMSSARADILQAIARCESTGHQFEADGRVRRNKQWVGLFQIDEGLYAKDAKGRGMNIYTAAGNMAYARVLLHSRLGLKHWASSEHCWGKRKNAKRG